MNTWYINKDYPLETQRAFANLDTVLAIKEGIFVSTSSISKVVRYSFNNRNFYIKYYFSPGKSLRRFFGRSRIRCEWENISFCKELNIKVPNVVAYGEQLNKFGIIPSMGVIVTEEIPNAISLRMIAHKHRELFNQHKWRKQVIQIVADYLRRLHNKKFIHYDLQWRNILVTTNVNNPEVYFFDIPCGRVRKFLFNNSTKRDFYCLYKNAVRFLSKTESLGFYMLYNNITHLSSSHKEDIRKIMRYFKRKKLNNKGSRLKGN